MRSVRYNIKKRLVSTKPSFKKDALISILSRSCAEVLCDEQEGGDDDDDEHSQISAAGRGLPGSAELRERLSVCIMRIIDQEPRTERMVVRLARTRQRRSGAASPFASSSSNTSAERRATALPGGTTAAVYSWSAVAQKHCAAS